jgi:hypothetical protein
MSKPMIAMRLSVIVLGFVSFEAGRTFGEPLALHPDNPHYFIFHMAPEAALQLDLPEGTYKGHWLDPLTGESTTIAKFTHSGGVATLAPPKVAHDIALRVVDSMRSK